MKKDADTQLEFRIAVVQPPAGVQFRLQEGRSDLVAPVSATAAELQFEFSLRLGSPRQGRPNFLGAPAQGPPASRFVYINSGRQAGQQGTPWDRRAKAGREIRWRASRPPPNEALEPRSASRLATRVSAMTTELAWLTYTALLAGSMYAPSERQP